jgi:hypothetical protein
MDSRMDSDVCLSLVTVWENVVIYRNVYSSLKRVLRGETLLELRFVGWSVSLFAERLLDDLLPLSSFSPEHLRACVSSLSKLHSAHQTSAP